MQRHVSPQAAAAARPGGVYGNQLTPMLAAAAAAASQPGLTPPGATLSAAALNAAISRALSPQPQMGQPMASLTSAVKPGTCDVRVAKWAWPDL